MSYYSTSAVDELNCTLSKLSSEDKDDEEELDEILLRNVNVNVGDRVICVPPKSGTSWASEYWWRIGVIKDIRHCGKIELCSKCLPKGEVSIHFEDGSVPAYYKCFGFKSENEDYYGLKIIFNYSFIEFIIEEMMTYRDI